MNAAKPANIKIEVTRLRAVILTRIPPVKNRQQTARLVIAAASPRSGRHPGGALGYRGRLSSLSGRYPRCALGYRGGVSYYSFSRAFPACVLSIVRADTQLLCSE
jgi:hypothetical protein